jgi:hypothetical protein
MTLALLALSALLGCSRAAPEPVREALSLDAGAARCEERSIYLTQWTPVTARNEDGTGVPCAWVLVHSGKGAMVWADPAIVELPK